MVQEYRSRGLLVESPQIRREMRRLVRDEPEAGRSDAGSVGCELMSDIADSGKWNCDVDVLFVVDDVDLQLVTGSGDADVVFSIFHVNERGVRIFAQLGGHNFDQWHVFRSVLGGLSEMLFRHKVHGHRNRGGWHPEVNMRACVAVLFDINADGAFAEGINAGDDDGAGKTKGEFSEDHLCSPGPLIRNVLGVEPYTDGV